MFIPMIMFYDDSDTAHRDDYAVIYCTGMFIQYFISLFYLAELIVKLYAFGSVTFFKYQAVVQQLEILF